MLKKLGLLVSCAALAVLSSGDAAAVTSYKIVRVCAAPGVCGGVPSTTMATNLTQAQCYSYLQILTPTWGQFPYTLACLPM